MERNTSREFVQWMHYIDREEWIEPSRLDHQIALVAQQVFRVGAMFASGRREIPSLDKFIVKFDERGGAAAERPAKKQYRLGDPLDEDWKRITEREKASWLGALAAYGVVPEYTPPRAS